MNNQNIKLRSIKRSDQKYFLKWWRDKELISLTSGIYEDSDDVLKEYFLEMIKSKNNHHYLILFKNKPIGNISLSKRNDKIFEIHIVIGDKKYWGKGIGPAAITKSLKIGFNKLRYEKAYLEVRPDNFRAIKAYQNSGFIKQGLKKYSKNKYQPIVLKMVLLSKSFPIKNNQKI